jgi:arylsulfatase A-like enzyme
MTKRTSILYRNTNGQRSVMVANSSHKHRLAKPALLSVAVICGALLASTAGAADSTNAPATAWPPSLKAPAGAPNIVLIVLDDVGYGWPSVFGGPVTTPNIDRLASRGLRYNNFHVNALCSPTRAALLSGRNAHEIGFGTITEGASSAPGYTSIWPKSAASVAEILKQNGYSTAAFGKWHNTPTWEVNPAGPFDHWPTSLGFEYFYGFLGGATTQYDPALFRNTTPVELPKTPEQGYLLNPDLVNQAEQWVHQHDASAPDRPFFLYFATGAIHAPHHVPRDWIAKYKGQFDLGWDKQREVTFAKEKALGVIPPNAELTPRPKELPAWDSLSADEQKLYAAQAEVYAAYLAETDYELGRLLDDLKSGGHTNDTAVFTIVGDNGASGEGGLEGTIGYKATVQEQLARLDEFGSRDLANHVESAWAWAAVTPFQWMKQVASHLGGTTDPLIVSWPGHIKDEGGLRSQFSFVTDIAPTIYELAHVQFPEVVDGVKQLPLEGASLAFSFDDAQAPSRHNLQYFEMVGNRGIYEDGWWAGSRQGVPWTTGTGRGEPGKWELYNLTNDFSQAHDLAGQYPDKLKELEDLYAAEAERNHVYPKSGAGFGGRAVTSRESRSNSDVSKTSWTFQNGAERIPARFTPRLGGHSHSITAEIEVGDETPNGVIFAEGGRKGGFALFVKNGQVIYEGTPHSTTPATAPHTQIIAQENLPKGRSVIEVVATRVEAPAGDEVETPRRNQRAGRSVDGNGDQAFQIALLINGKTAATGEFDGVPLGGGNTLSIGQNLGNPVSRDYATPNPFNGVLDGVTFTITSPAAQANVNGPWRKGEVLDPEEAPEVADHALVVTAEIEPAGTNGVIISQGAGANGYALYLQAGKPAFAIRSQGELTTVTAGEPLGSGHFKIEGKLATDGTITISVDGRQVATGHAPGLIATQPARGLTVGSNEEPVGDYAAPNRFSGKIENVFVQTL